MGKGDLQNKSNESFSMLKKQKEIMAPQQLKVTVGNNHSNQIVIARVIKPTPDSMLGICLIDEVQSSDTAVVRIAAIVPNAPFATTNLKVGMLAEKSMNRIALRPERGSTC